MKLVGKINIKVWDGDPNEPNSKLKQEVEEYNNIHPDFASLWDKESYVEELLNVNDRNQHTHPLSGKKGKVLFPGEYGWGVYLDCRIGLGNDTDLLLQKHVAGGSKEVTKELSGSGINYAGYCESLEMINLYKSSWYGNSWIEPGDYDSNDFSELYRNLMANLVETKTNSVLLPLPDNYPIKLFTKSGIETTLNPTGLTGSMKSISIVICGEYSSKESYISPLKKDTPKPLTLHKFSSPISFKETDYISISYDITFITEFRVEGIKEVTIMDKEGNPVKGVRFPAIFGLRGTSKSTKLQWVDPEAPKVPCSVRDPWRSYTPRINNMFSGATFTPPVTLTIAGKPLETISYSHCKSAFGSIAETAVYEEYDNMLLHEFINKRYINNPLKESELLPLVNRSTGNFYDYIRKVSNHAEYENRQKVSLKFKIAEPPRITVKLPAVDSSEMNIPYYLISETICGTTHDRYIISDGDGSAEVVYFTLFETPLIKTKYDEIALSINQFMEGVPGLCPEISSKTTEE